MEQSNFIKVGTHFAQGLSVFLGEQSFFHGNKSNGMEQNETEWNGMELNRAFFKK